MLLKEKHQRIWIAALLSLSIAACANTGSSNKENKLLNIAQMNPDTSHQAIADTNIVNDSVQIATFGAGCFWCVEAVYSSLSGVLKVQSGYSGGSTINPSYKEVCSGNTGHAEVCQITFDPRVITYAQLLEVLFDVHDPTTLNRQGNDEGTQYRSVIYYHDNSQKALAELAIKAANESGNWPDPVVTEITAFQKFYAAEDYHNDYFALHGEQPYCQMVVKPKVDKFKKHFEALLKK
ncbi:MAG: peptide-methionine (S)-S-oxide reductase MsrA [Flavobacteriales bacterium]